MTRTVYRSSCARRRRRGAWRSSACSASSACSSAWPSGWATCSTGSMPAPTSSTPSACRSTRRWRRSCSRRRRSATRPRTARSSTSGCGRCRAGGSAWPRCWPRWTVALPDGARAARCSPAALSGRRPGLVRGTLLSASSPSSPTAALFVLLGLWVRRALLWGLAYILLWEGFVAIAGQNAQRLAIRSYTRSLLRDATGVDLFLADIGRVAEHRGAARRGRDRLRPHRLAAPAHRGGLIRRGSSSARSAKAVPSR